MAVCPILKWYMPDDPENPRDLPYPINSVVEGSIELIETKEKGKETYKVRIVTNELEKRKVFFECDVADQARKVLEYEAKNQPKGKARHYGLIIMRPGPELKEHTMVTDFISYHRHPTDFTTEPTACRYGISAYNEEFERRATEEEVLKEKPSKNPKPIVGRNAMENSIETVLKVITLKERLLNLIDESYSLGESYSKNSKPVDPKKVLKVLEEMINQLEDAAAPK